MTITLSDTNITFNHRKQAVMGQLWNRIRRVTESYINDFTHDVDLSNIDPKILEELRAKQQHSSPSGYRRGYETEEERLKRLIDEAANPQGTGASSSQSASGSGREQESRRQAGMNGGMNLSDALQVLGVSSNASNDDIKRTYKQLMMKFHPDRVSHLDTAAQAQAREKAQRINQAYQIIKDHKGL